MSASPKTRATQVLARIGLAIPASGEIEYAEFIAGQDDAARLIMSMSAADWAKLESQPPLAGIDKRLFSTDNQFHLGRDQGDWNPRANPLLLVAQTSLKDGAEALNVGYVRAGADQVRMYLFWHQL